MIRDAKFPKRIEVASYNQIRRRLSDALAKPRFGRDDLDFLADRLEATARRESGYKRDEALRCVRAIRAFQATFKPKTFSRVELSAAPKGISTTVEGVRINVSLDAMVTVTQGDLTNSGGIVLLYAFSADRGAVADRLSNSAGLILWALEGGQMEPLPRLCMAADLAGETIVKASGSHTRFRERVTDSCAEVAARWKGIEPPHDYDGPEWQ